VPYADSPVVGMRPLRCIGPLPPRREPVYRPVAISACAGTGRPPIKGAHADIHLPLARRYPAFGGFDAPAFAGPRAIGWQFGLLSALASHIILKPLRLPG
jgi:hypothetical protein